MLKNIQKFGRFYSLNKKNKVYKNIITIYGLIKNEFLISSLLEKWNF